MYGPPGGKGCGANWETGIDLYAALLMVAVV